LIFWGYAASPFCKIVRERLGNNISLIWFSLIILTTLMLFTLFIVELEIPHIQKTWGRGSAKRQELFEKTGRFQVPYLEDPNTGVNLFESSDIIDYINEKYSV
jgi:glutathione S-transferase